MGRLTPRDEPEVGVFLALMLLLGGALLTVSIVRLVVDGLTIVGVLCWAAAIALTFIFPGSGDENEGTES